MGYVLSAYIVDTAKLSNALGSGDSDLVAQIVRSNPDEFDDDDDFPANGRRPSLVTALEALIHRGVYAADDDAQYRYAFEELLRFVGDLSFGDRYDPDQIGFSTVRDYDLPIAIPNPGEFPVIACVSYDRIDAELARMANTSSGEDTDPELPRLWIDTLASAKRRKTDVWITRG